MKRGCLASRCSGRGLSECPKQSEAIRSNPKQSEAIRSNHLQMQWPRLQRVTEVGALDGDGEGERDVGLGVGAQAALGRRVQRRDEVEVLACHKKRS